MPRAGTAQISMAPLGVRQGQPADKGRQGVVLLGPEDQVPMVRHHTIEKESHGMLRLRIAQGSQKRAIVSCVAENLGAAVGAVENVINQPACLSSVWPSHPRMVPRLG